MEIKIIGLGGIGSILSGQLSRFLNFSQEGAHVTLIDGDEFEAKNYQRQEFINLGNKAAIKAEELGRKFDEITFDSVTNYINTSNVSDVIKENDIVLLCVDNHMTRKIVSDHVCTLNNVTLISGGNEFTDGNVQIHKRQEGVNVTPTLTDYHPEIESPEDRSPEDMSCEELSKSEPQLLFTNLAVVSLMCQAFYTTVVEKLAGVSEVYFDMLQLKADSKVRTPLK